MRRPPGIIAACLAAGFVLVCSANRRSVVYRFDLKALAEAHPGASVFRDESPLGKPALLLRGEPDGGVFRLTEDSKGIPWTRARFLAVDVYHDGPVSVALSVHFNESGPNPASISSKMGILPGLPTRLVLPLEYLDGQTFFMKRQARRLKGSMPGSRLVKERMGEVTLDLFPDTEEYPSELWIGDIRLMTAEPDPLPGAKPLVDSLGQWKSREWPGKAASVAGAASELRALESRVRGSALPEDWSRYGGWKGERFEATGFFRTQWDGRRWWLADPDGFAFFSMGIDCMRPTAEGPVSGMDDLFEWLPDSTGPFAQAWNSRGRNPGFSHHTANLIRAFGVDWEPRWRALAVNLMKTWRFNTVGNWSDSDFARSASMPYVIPLRGFPETGVKLYRDFPDVFSEEYRRNASPFAAQLEPLKNDPFLIGYFLDNEPLWAFGKNNLAAEMLATAQASETRKALVKWLKGKYRGDAKAWSLAWKTDLGSFDALLSEALRGAAAASPQAESDLWEFSRVMVREYLKHPCEALAAVDPNHMNLGIRYAWISSELCYEAGAAFDVFSINMYLEAPDPAVIAEIVKRTGKPVMIGEFHHGAVDRGLPSTGIWGVATQADRGLAYRYYMEQGAALPGLVGMHLFQMNDQPVLGRSDGENYNIGLLDVCVKPYPEFTGAVRAANEGLYRVASGERKATRVRAKSIPAIYF